MTMMRLNNEDRKQLRKHANRNITYLLDQLGVSYSERGNLIQASCPCSQHGGDRDNDTAFSWRVDIGYWVCWSHACEEVYGNDIFGLVRSVLNLKFHESIAWLNDRFKEHGINTSEKISGPTNAGKEIFHIHEPLDENRLRFLKPNPEYLINRGFDPDVLRRYEVGSWHRLGTYMHDHVVVPVRDHENHLVGFTGRTIHNKDWHEKRGIKYIKWKHSRYYDRFPRTGDFFTGSILYNLYRAKKYIGENKILILVEGPLDGFKLDMAGIYNWVATLGTKFGPNHRSLLVQLGINKLYVAYDNDSPRGPKQESPGQKGWERVQSIVGDLFELERVPLPIDEDLGSMSVPTIRQVFDYVKT
jgi:hypothetical protein